MNRYHNILEFPKIIELLKEDAVLEETQQNITNYQLMDEISDIEIALSEVDEATILMQRMQRFPLYFSTNSSIILTKTQKSGVLDEEELLEIGKLLDTVKNISIYLDSLKGANISTIFFQKYEEQLSYPKELNLRIKEIITPYGEIKDDATGELFSLRKRVRDTEKNIQFKLQEIISKNATKLTQSVVSIRNDRYVIPVKNDYRNTIKGIIHDQSASGETVFIEPQIIVVMNNQLNTLKEEENKEVYRILRNISEQIALHFDELLHNYHIICKLDLIFTKASYALKIDAKKPYVNKQGIFELIRCRHPLLKVEKVVCNNVLIGKDYQGIIITGPNTGGKTVLLKTIGLLSIMVKFGLLIPADETSNVMIFDNVYADIGDEQSIDQNLSTFSSHMKNVINIMNSVTHNSLVVVDELGSGTDPLEGSALAIAIFDTLIEKKCLVVATSHYSELKVHAYNSNSIINASVEFDVETLKPTYRLLMGVPGQSNALKISKILGLDSKIIEKAENVAYQKNDDLSLVLDKLTQQSKELDDKLQLIDQKRVELQEQVNSVELEKRKIVESKNNILKKAEEEANKIVKKSQTKIDALLQELEEMKLKEVKLHEVSNVKKELRELKEEIHVEEEIIENEEDFTLNATVYVETYGAYGTIIKINKNDKYDVQMGIATITVDKKHLKSAKKPKVVTKNQSVVLAPKRSVSMTLDLRGERFEDAKERIEKFLDDALYGGLMQVSIIHGFGTGVIRELVQTELRKSKLVESFRYGGANEGGKGVTIALLKNK